MNNSTNPKLPTTRREFLRISGAGIGLLAFSRFAPSFLVQSTLGAAPLPEKDRTVLVLIQLAGGNDGLNTVIPYQDDDYHRLRPTLGLKKEQVLAIDDQLGFNPGCAALNEMIKDGKLGIIQNVGYPNPNRSHFRSTEIWESASDSNINESSGWIGRYLDNTCPGKPVDSDPQAVHVSSEVPQTFFGDEPHPTFSLGANAGHWHRGHANHDANSLLRQLVDDHGHAHDEEHDNEGFLRSTIMDAMVTDDKVQNILGKYRTDAKYPGGGFAQALRNVAALIASGLSTRVYFVSLGGFDTHAGQANRHENLLKTLSEGMAAFQKDIDSKGLGQQVLTMTFSEFGRRPFENESAGTDHGTAAPLFVMGSTIKGPLHGTAPKLAGLDRKQDLTYSTDFRQVYATVLDRWLDCPSEKVLGQKFDPLKFI